MPTTFTHIKETLREYGVELAEDLATVKSSEEYYINLSKLGEDGMKKKFGTSDFDRFVEMNNEKIMSSIMGIF